MSGRCTTAVVGALLGALAITAPAVDAQHAVARPIDGRPDAVVDLRTGEGAALVQGQWRYSDVRLVNNGAGVEYQPKAGAAGFDDSGWEPVAPTALDRRRGPGRFSFNWYRLQIVVPERIGAVETTGATIVFETVVDDYAEITVDGRLPRVLGQSGGSLVRGFNAPNRLVLTRDARPGQRFQLAIFGANAPLSDPPANAIWIRSATLDVYRPNPGNAGSSGRVQRHDPALDAIVPPGTIVEKLAAGFQFTEGPVWMPDGYLLFSDPNNNTIYRWSEDEGVSVYRVKSGYAGTDIGEYRQPGSNGLALDAEGRLTINEHGNRRVVRLEKNGDLTVLADRYDGKRLNSPNDLVYRKSDGALYFTDPPFGLPKAFDDPRRELPFSGIFRLKDGRLQLLGAELSGPNGLAFSPDERYLYVGNWDEKRKVVMRYDVLGDGTFGSGRVFVDMTSAAGEDAIDGIKVDARGNVFVSGPGGVWILSPDGRHLGTLEAAEHPHNMAWGDADGQTLYLAARTGLYRVRLGTTD